MRKQAEQLLVGRVYADIDGDNIEPIFMRFEQYIGNEHVAFRCVSNNGYYLNGYHLKSEDGLVHFRIKEKWYELTPEEDAIYNKPSEPVFTLSDIQRVIERIEDGAKEYDMDWCQAAIGLRKAIEIMRDELKIDAKS